MAINLVQKPQGGGILGAIGTVLGAIAGVAAAPFTGGASLLPTLGAASTGIGIGKTVGGLGDAALNKQNQPKGVGDFTVSEGKPQMGAADVIGKVGDVVGMASSAAGGVDKLLGGAAPGISQGGAIGRRALTLGANTSLGEDPSLALSRQLQNIKRRF